MIPRHRSAAPPARRLPVRTAAAVLTVAGLLVVAGCRVPGTAGQDAVSGGTGAATPSTAASPAAAAAPAVTGASPAPASPAAATVTAATTSGHAGHTPPGAPAGTPQAAPAAGQPGHDGHGGGNPAAAPNEALAPVTTDPAAYAGDGMGGIFVVLCGTTTHRAADDPIVRPGRPGASHLHDFFGNTTTDAFSTTASLAGGPDSRCDVKGDQSGYWVPTTYQRGAILEPEKLEVYYADLFRTGRTVAPPSGFRMLAGDASGQRPTEGRLGWSCGGEDVPPWDAVPPTDCTTQIAMRVDFPDCWDGTNLDSADHASHVAYSSFDLGAFALACPASHPVPIPQLRLNVYFPTTDGTGITFSSGGMETIHGDFLNAWDAARLGGLVTQLNDGGLNPLPGVPDTLAEILGGLEG